MGLTRNYYVEYMHAFDIHCNGFVTFYFFSVSVQYPLLPIILNSSFFATLVSNGLYLTGVLYYLYVALLGYYCMYELK
mgnify:CR=1 FL=1